MTDALHNPRTHEGVPFTFFCSLAREISKLRPSSIEARRKRGSPSSNQPFTYPALQVFRNWVLALRAKFSPLPPNTGAICFRLLFPEEDVLRKYDVQEKKMAGLLADCFGMDVKQFDEWSLEQASGCLGQEVKVVLDKVSSHADDFISPITVAQVDELLDELAANSGWSDKSIRSKFSKEGRRPRKEIMRSLFRGLSPHDASVLTQIILKDLRPLLYPLTEYHYTVALTRYNTAAVKMLTVEHAMDVWDPSRMLSRFYRMRASLNDATAFAEQPNHAYADIKPEIGSPIRIPKSEKALDSGHALNFFKDSSAVWAETKYDGERAQIHVEIRADGSSHITIFSKSKRESTHDRRGVHEVIRAALGLGTTNNRGHDRKVQVTQNVILDAEMVAFRGDKVEEFWHIRQLIGETAYGIRGRWGRSNPAPPSYEHESMDSQATEGLNLGLVFLDVLYLDSRSLLDRTYKERRKLLEDLVQVENGKAILASRYRVDMLSAEPDATLALIFSEHLAVHEEGLVLKAEDSYYNDYRKPWVKMKKDYIDGHGDCLDLVILGASWEKARGRSLRVPPTTFTTFYIGALANKQEISQTTSRPSFHMYFTASYGLNRDQLEDLNFFIKNSETICCSKNLASKDLAYDLTIFEGLKPPPTVLLCTPLLVELYGAGFTKANNSQHYELRFPRITKFHRPSERGWREAVDLDSLHAIACKCVGRDRSDKDIDDGMNDLWKKPSSPGINCPIKRKNRTEEWYNKLAEAEGRPKLKRARLDAFPLDISRSCSEYTLSSHGKVESPAKKYSRPLAARTNIMLHEPLFSPHEPIVLPKAKHSLQLTVPRSPLTPRCSPTGPLVLARKSSPKRVTAPMKNASVLTTVSKELAIYPSDIRLDSTLVYFAKPGGKCCSSYKDWRRIIHRPVHSLGAIMLGCGWTQDGMNAKSHIKKGIIILDECDDNATEWKTRILDSLKDAPLRTRVEISIYGCKSATKPLYELK